MPEKSIFNAEIIFPWAKLYLYGQIHVFYGQKGKTISVWANSYLMRNKNFLAENSIFPSGSWEYYNPKIYKQVSF